jgi:hypothetical protein
MRSARIGLLSLWLFGLGGCAAPAVPQAQQYASMSGTVVDAATNAPITGATVTVDVVFVVTTGANGAFSVTNLPNGPVSCSASAPNYVTRNNDWCSQQLAPGQSLTGVTVKLSHN